METLDYHTLDTTKDLDRVGKPHNVRLSDPEQSAYERYDLALDANASVMDAAEFALSSMLPLYRTAEFVDWLSDGTMRMLPNGTLVRVTTVNLRPILGPAEVVDRREFRSSELPEEER